MSRLQERVEVKTDTRIRGRVRMGEGICGDRRNSIHYMSSMDALQFWFEEETVHGVISDLAIRTISNNCFSMYRMNLIKKLGLHGNQQSSHAFYDKGSRLFVSQPWPLDNSVKKHVESYYLQATSIALCRVLNLENAPFCFTIPDWEKGAQ